MRAEIINLLIARMEWSADKAELWMQTENPFLGGGTPNHMIEMGRGHKVLRFIESVTDENRHEEKVQTCDSDGSPTTAQIVAAMEEQERRQACVLGQSEKGHEWAQIIGSPNETCRRCGKWRPRETAPEKNCPECNRLMKPAPQGNRCDYCQATWVPVKSNIQESKRDG